MEIKRIKNYKDLADKFKEITKCDEVKIAIISSNSNHYHFGMLKDGLPIATICYDNGDLSVLPFTRVEDSNNSSDAWLNANKLPIFDDFTILMNGLRDLAVERIL